MPVLGNTAIAFASDYTICNNPLGSLFTFNGGACQKAISMTTWLKYITTQRTWKVKCGIYLHNAPNPPILYAETEERDITPNAVYEPYVFNFATPVDLVDGTDYILVGFANGSGFAYTLYQGRNAGAVNQAHGAPENNYSLGFPSPLAFSHFDHIYAVSLDYEQGCVGTFLR